MKGWIAQNSHNGLITFFTEKPKKYYIGHSKEIWMWAAEGGETFHLNDPMLANRELLPNKAVNYIHFIDMLGFKRNKDNIEGFGQWEGISTKEPREVELKLELI